MRKRIKGQAVILLCMTVVLLGSLVAAGCAAPTTPTPTPTPTPAPTPTPTPTPAPAPEVIKWERWQDSYAYSPGMAAWDITGVAAVTVKWIEWVEQATNGRLLITRHEPGALVSGLESFNAVSEGMIDAVGHTYGAYFAGTVPEANIEMGMPFAWENHDEGWYGFYRTGLIERLREIFAEHNVFYFAPTLLNEPYYHLATTFPCHSIDDVKGKKIRAGGIYGEYVKALGGTPVNLPAAEMYMGLKLGTIDGILYGVGGIADFKLDEVLDYYVVYPNTSCIVAPYIINLDTWNALPQDLKDILLRDTPYVLQGLSSDYHEQSKLKMANMAKAGTLTPISWSEEDAAKAREIAVTQVWPTVAALGPRNAELVDLVTEQARLFGKIR